MARWRSWGPTAAKLRSLSSAYVLSALLSVMRCLLPASVPGALLIMPRNNAAQETHTDSTEQDVGVMGKGAESEDMFIG